MAADVTGLGVAVNLRAPWNTILRADVGKSLLPADYRGAGSTVFQIMLLKPSEVTSDESRPARAYLGLDSRTEHEVPPEPRLLLVAG